MTLISPVGRPILQPGPSRRRRERSRRWIPLNGHGVAINTSVQRFPAITQAHEEVGPLERVTLVLRGKCWVDLAEGGTGHRVSWVIGGRWRGDVVDGSRAALSQARRVFGAYWWCFANESWEVVWPF